MPAARIPRYLTVYDSLKRKIEAGEYPPGTLLPPEPELGRIYNLSRTTIRSALELLANHGFVSVRQGVGTLILSFKATQRLQYVTSFSETLVEQGFQVRHKMVSIEQIEASPAEVSDLGITDTGRLVRIERVAFANERPIAIMVNFLKAQLVPRIEDRRASIGSLYAFLEREYGITIDGATDYIRASVAGDDDSQKLEIGIGEPLLLVKRISFRDGQPFELAQLRIIADRYEYAVHTRERPLSVSTV